MVRDIKQHYDTSKVMVVSPDVGGVVRARNVARRIGAPLAIVDKRRPKAGVSEVMNVIGDVEGHSCIMIDDIVDSGGTLCNAAEALLKQGAKEVSAYITHGVLSGKACERIGGSKLKELVISDSILETDVEAATANIRRFSIAELMGEALRAPRPSNLFLRFSTKKSPSFHSFKGRNHRAPSFFCPFAPRILALPHCPNGINPVYTGP